LQGNALHNSTGLGQQHHLELLAPHAGRNIILSFVMSPVFRIRILFFPDPDPEVEAGDQYQLKKTFNFFWIKLQFTYLKASIKYV
jgi:hypothetical protein